MTPIIEAEELRKSYRIRQQRAGLANAVKSFFSPEIVTHRALDDISFSVEPGAICGLIGSNGAGKSTLIKLLVGIMRRDGGSLRVNGLDPFLDRKRYVRRIGVVFGQRSNLLWDLSVRESFDLHCAIFDVPRREYHARLEELTAIFGLGDILNQPSRTLSLGQTMRCAVAQVLLQQPDILFLDEPTIGLDVVSVERLGETLKNLNKTFNTTIFITSHDLSVIENLCSQVLLMEDGRMLFDGTARQAIDKYGRYRKLRFVFASNGDLAAAADLLQGKGIAVTRDALELSGVVDAEKATPGVLVALADDLAKGHGLVEFFMEKPSLKEVILHAFQ